MRFCSSFFTLWPKVLLINSGIAVLLIISFLRVITSESAGAVKVIL